MLAKVGWQWSTTVLRKLRAGRLAALARSDTVAGRPPTECDVGALRWRVRLLWPSPPLAHIVDASRSCPPQPCPHPTSQHQNSHRDPALRRVSRLPTAICWCCAPGTAGSGNLLKTTPKQGWIENEVHSLPTAVESTVAAHTAGSAAQWGWGSLNTYRLRVRVKLTTEPPPPPSR